MTHPEAAQGRSPIEVVTLGECLVGLVAAAPGPLAETTRFERHVAGSEANVAVGLGRLGHSAALIGRVGADGFGTAIVRRLRGEGVDVSGVRVDEAAPTGLMIRERRLLGPAEVLYYRTGSAGSRLGVEDVSARADLFAVARHMHVSGITPALSASCRAAVDEAIRLARAAGMSISLDLNIRRKLWNAEQAAASLRALIPQCDVVMGSLEEAALVVGVSSAVPARAGAALSAGAGSAAPSSDGAEPAGWPTTGGLDPIDVAYRLRTLGPGVVVLKLGSAGAIEVHGDEPAVSHEGFAVAQVVDPVGAGDAFAAGYLAGMLEGLAPMDCLELGNAAGASVVASLGDMTGLPTRVEIERLVEAAGDAIR